MGTLKTIPITSEGEEGDGGVPKGCHDKDGKMEPKEVVDLKMQHGGIWTKDLAERVKAQAETQRKEEEAYVEKVKEQVKGGKVPTVDEDTAKKVLETMAAGDGLGKVERTVVEEGRAEL